MKRVLSSASALLLGAFLATGCGSDSTGPSADLTAEESLEVFGEVLAAVFAVGFGDGGGSPQMLAATGASGADLAAALVETINETVPCEGGGSITVQGTIDDDTDENGNGTFTFNLTETLNNCGIQTESGQSYRVNGAPHIQMAGAMTFTEEGPAGPFTMSFNGGLAWTSTSGGRSGTCSLNLNYSIDMSTFVGSVQGSICGHAVNETF
jgi:hypothetical protein